MSAEATPSLEEILHMQVTSAEETIAGYYENGSVRRRLSEYAGGDASEEGAKVAGYGGRRGLHAEDGAPVVVAPADRASLLSEGADVCRSLADARGTLVHLDLDYVNPLEPREPYLEAERIFARLEPVHQAIVGLFAGYDLHPLVLMTGRGYHYVLRVANDTRFHHALVEVGSVSDEMKRRYRLEADGRAALARARAHDGAGRLLEHLAHRVIERVRGNLPVHLADVPPAGQGPFACLDLSAYGDPLETRFIRSAFSSNQKASVSGFSSETPFAIVLPRGSFPFSELLGARTEPERAQRLALVTRTEIPDAPESARAWVDDYRRSALFRFHEAFTRDAGDPRRLAALGIRSLPPCAALPLLDPYPALLQPGRIRVVTVVLSGMGWSAKDVALLVKSRYELGAGWRDLWGLYDPATRANLYVRLFAGLRAAGLDGADELSCATEESRGVCPLLRCGRELADFTASSSAARKEKAT